MATLAERYWQELRPSAAAVRRDLEPLAPARRRLRRRAERERVRLVAVRRGR
jgi:hypothetical protein